MSIEEINKKWDELKLDISTEKNIADKHMKELILQFSYGDIQSLLAENQRLVEEIQRLKVITCPACGERLSWSDS